MNFIEEIIEKDLASGSVDKIITRFPPEPNGYLHIGHAKAICLNYYGTAVKYSGKFNLRFDDTNPAKEDMEYVNSIIEDIKWLGAEGEIFYASDYFDTMYSCAMTLIRKGLAYVDDASSELMRQMRGTLTEKGTESKYRNRSIDESLQLFADMKNGLIADGGLVLRAKIDMSSPNINMRDPIIYRVLRAHHHRQGDKWNIYPMYDFAHPIEDAIEHITHSICTLEFEDHRPLYDWVINNCDLDGKPHQYEFARLNITRMIMSKRYLKKLVDERIVAGWDDPRMPTLAGLRRRGYTASSIREFCDRIGVAKANSEVEVGQLESCIREEYNLTAERTMVVLKPLLMKITNRASDFVETLDFEMYNRENSETRPISISNELWIEQDDFAVVPPPKYHRLTVGGMVRLKSGYIVKCNGYEFGDNGNVTAVLCDIVEGTRSGQDNSGIKVKGVVHWVDAKNCANITVNMYDYLLVDDDGTNKDFAERINQNSLQVFGAKAEPQLLAAPSLKAYQFMRTGYFVRDSRETNPVFNLTVGLKDSFAKKK